MEQPSKDRPLEKIVRAVRKAHERRLGCSPNTILVHLDLVPEKTLCAGIALVPHRGILKHHYHAIYIGEK